MHAVVVSDGGGPATDVRFALIGALLRIKAAFLPYRILLLIKTYMNSLALTVQNDAFYLQKFCKVAAASYIFHATQIIQAISIFQDNIAPTHHFASSSTKCRPTVQHGC